jgi:hypothetical protein
LSCECLREFCKNLNGASRQIQSLGGLWFMKKPGANISCETC